MTQENILDTETAVLGEDGLATQAGWIKVYHANPYSREFSGSDFEYVAEGVGLSAHSYLDAPDLPGSDDMAVRRSEDGSYWEIVPDHRGKIAYNTQVGAQEEVAALGELPETLTFEQPSTDFDQWDGEKWVTDFEAQKISQVEQAEQQRAIFRRQADEAITVLQYAVETEMASEAEKTLLLDWKKYLVLLRRVDVSSAPDINWPEKPKE
ncbi:MULTISPECIES: tail fiber assembly protein [Photorhabdus]|uniref:tail fiber assembly protein n=1 Tax=Photorhabdus TaxID=29487 RepID=UPI000DCF35AF|nr:MULTISPECIES: tail fiber assembly protein [Photorhabdus]MCT8344945.1 tail fiber assembly protein [Photorhabdus kleinii]RAX00793.1 phage tail protein [Photorhabdus sp. S9-53]RAX00996.1 phage tail protein [Photorhabdus sp. S10-54]RAX05335.1 phage tail protein [Photorhabdus sp. S8-52]